MEPDDRTAAEQFGEAMHRTLARLEKVERQAKRSADYADQAVKTANEYVQKFNAAEGELKELRALVAELRPSEPEVTLKPEVKPLPCIVCGMQPDSAVSVYGGSRQPHGATMFSAGSGNYGSTVWDTMSSHRSLEINVCDDCLRERKGRAAVLLTSPNRPDEEWVPWDEFTY